APGCVVGRQPAAAIGRDAGDGTAGDPSRRRHALTPVFVETLAGALFRHAWPLYRPLYFGFKRWQDATEIAFVRHAVRRGDIVVDVGANVGFQARLFAELVGPDGRVYAFEPDGANFRRLTAVVRGLPQVQIARAALSDAPGTLTLFPSPRL